MFDSKAGTIQFIVGNNNDIFCIENEMFDRFEDYLYNALKTYGYKEVYVFQSNIYDFKEWNNKINNELYSEWSKEAKDISLLRCEDNDKVIITTHNLVDDEHYTLIELFEEILLSKMLLTEHNVAIVLPYECISMMDNDQGKLSYYLRALNINKNYGNILILRFDNIFQLDTFAKEHKSLFPEYDLISHEHTNELSLKSEYMNFLQDRLVYMNEIGIDEIRNILEVNLIYDQYVDDLFDEKIENLGDATEEDSDDYEELLNNIRDLNISDIARYIKNDISVNDVNKKDFPFIHYNSYLPLLSIKNSLFNNASNEEEIVDNLDVIYNNLKIINDKINKEQDYTYGDELKNYLDNLDMLPKEKQKRGNKYQIIRMSNESEIIIDEYTKNKMNLILCGNPGVGKTTFVRRLGKELLAKELIKDGHVVEVSKADLKGQYVGESAIKTKNKILEAEGGILFIDEFYNFSKGNEHDTNAVYDQEVINTILVSMTNPKVHVVFVVAGYYEPTMDVIRSYEGLESRFGKVIQMQDYDAKWLWNNIANQDDKETIKKLFKTVLGKDYVSDENMINYIEKWMYNFKTNTDEEYANIRTFKTRFIGPLKQQSMSMPDEEKADNQEKLKVFIKDTEKLMDLLVPDGIDQDMLDNQIIYDSTMLKKLKSFPKYVQYFDNSGYITIVGKEPLLSEVAKRLGNEIFVHTEASITAEIVENYALENLDIENKVFINKVNVNEMHKDTLNHRYVVNLDQMKSDSNYISNLATETINSLQEKFKIDEGVENDIVEYYQNSNDYLPNAKDELIHRLVQYVLINNADLKIKKGDVKNAFSGE